MLPPALPPPLPRKRRQTFWWVLFGVLFAGIMVAMGVAIKVGWESVTRQVESRRVARKAFKELQDGAAEERRKMADALTSGEEGVGDKALERLKGQLNKTAGSLTGDEAAGMKAMGKFLSLFQEQLRVYEKCSARLRDADAFTFPITDRETLGKHRQMVRDFLDANSQMTDTLVHAEERIRHELEVVHVPERKVNQTMAGFSEAMGSREIQLRIRAQDKILGEAMLAVHDLLEREWGKWSRNSETLRFQNADALATFNAHVRTVQEAADIQLKAQQELAVAMRKGTL